MNKYKYLICLFGLVFFSQGCQKDEIGVKDTTVIQSGPIETIQAEVVGIVTNEAGEAMPNVEVQYKASFINTDENGYFKFSNVTAAFDGGLLKFRNKGYFKNYKWFYPKVSDKAFLRVIMVAEKEVGSVSATEESLIEMNGGATVSFPANAFEGISTGNIKVLAHWYNPASDKLAEEMPGDLRAIDADNTLVQLATYGMVAVELRDANGNDIQLRDGIKATISFPVSDNLISDAPKTIKTWSFDEDRAYWNEEGTAVLEGSNYIAEVSHFSFWNCDAPFPVVHITGRLVDKNENALSAVKICITDLSRSITRVGWTSYDGTFSGKIPKDAPLKIVAKDECTGVVYEGAIGPFSEDIDLGDVIADAAKSVLISGVLVCDGVPFTNGYALIILPSGVQFIAEPNNEGQFEFNLPSCDVDKISIKGYNLDDNSATDWNIYDLFENIILAGDIEVCDGNLFDEYIKYKMDSGTELLLEKPEAVLINDQLFLSASNLGDDFIEIRIINPSSGSNATHYTIAAIASQQKFGICGTNGVGADCLEMESIFKTLDLTVGGLLEGTFMGQLETDPAGTNPTLMGEFKIKLDKITTTSVISGTVWIDTNNDGLRDANDTDVTPVRFCRVDLYQDGMVMNSVWTEEDGAYAFEVEEGNYSLGFSLAQGYKFVDLNTGISDVNPATGKVDEFYVDGINNYTFDVGKYWDDNINCEAVVSPATCGNDNGSYYIKDNALDSLADHTIETVLDGISISTLDYSPYLPINDLPVGKGDFIIRDAAGIVVCSGAIEIKAEAMTCFVYPFVDCEAGNYIAGIELECNNSSQGGYSLLWETGETSNWINIPTLGTYGLTVTDNDGCSAELEVLFEYEDFIQITGIVWSDSIIGTTNRLDPVDRRLENVQVNVFEASDLVTPIRSTLSNADGYYSFNDLPYGTAFYVGLETPAGYELVEKGTDPDFKNTDSDIDQATGLSDKFEIVDCSSFYQVFIGLVPK